MITYKNEITAAEYNDMRAAVGWMDLNEELAARGLENSAYIVSAWDGDKPVGMARIVGDGGYMQLIADVMVIPEYQGKGVGAQIMYRIDEYLDSLGDNGNPVMVNLMATTGNEKFYEKFGYVQRPNEGMGAGMVRWINGSE